MSYVLPSQGASTITILGTVTTGVWQGSTFTVAKGGTNLTSTTANQLLYSSSNNVIAGLSSAASAVLITSSGSVPSLSTSLPASLTIPQPNNVGTTTNNNAAAGSVGEFVSSQILAASPVSMSVSTTFYDITSISLTAGDWDIFGLVNINFTGNGYGMTTWINSASVSYPGTENVATRGQGSTLGPFFPGADNGEPTPTRRFSLSATTTIYLTGIAYYTTGTANGCGILSARRIR